MIPGLRAAAHGCGLALALLAAPLSADELAHRLDLAEPDRGRVVFGPCRICHSLDPARPTGLGPNLAGIFGRVVGSQADFPAYSATFRDAQFVWTPKLMYNWLADPMRFYPGSSMMSLGVPDPQDRADLIAWLMQVAVERKTP